MNIVLIGPSGIGKTTVGNYISREYKFKHIDTDDLIENKYNTTIGEIFRSGGEKYFRELESNIIENINEENAVISTGGGVVLVKENIFNLKKHGIVYLLFGSIETIINNIKKSSIERPLIGSKLDCYENIRRLYIERKNLYTSYADYIINVDFKSVPQISGEIISIYEKHFSCSK